MVLFHAISSFQLILVTLIKISQYPQQKSTLIISLDVVRRLGNYKDFLYFFNDIIIYDNAEGNRIIERNGNLTKYFNNIFKENKLDISKYEKIYLACAHNCFGIYISINNIQYVFIEDGVGALSRPEILHNIDKIYVKKDEFSIEYNLYDGSNPNAIYCIYNANFQKKDFTHLPKYKHFDISDTLKKLDDETIGVILKIFTNNLVVDCKKDAVVILTEHFANLNIFTWEEQILAYQLVVDYYFENKSLLFKAHPDDLMYYEKLFNNISVIRNKFPAELLPYIFKNKPKTALTLSSTSIHTLKCSFENTISFNYNFTHKHKEFRCLHKIFVALKFAEKFDSKCIYLFGLNEIIVENFIKLNKTSFAKYKLLNNIFEFNNIQDSKVIIIDNISYYGYNHRNIINEFLESLPKDKIVIFINSVEDYAFYNIYDKILLKNINVITIKKEIYKEVYFDYDKDEYIYYFSKSLLEPFEIKYNLPQSGINILGHFTNKKDSNLTLIKKLIEGINIRILCCLKGTDTLNYNSDFILNNANDYTLLEKSFDTFENFDCYERTQFKILKQILLVTEKKYLDIKTR